MITITDKGNCTGCHACASACPKNCIEMVADNEGFLYPIADADLCVNCGLCEKICPIINGVSKNLDNVSFAVVNKDEETRFRSSSGGVFPLLAEQVINNGGVVFGAAFDRDFMTVEHIAVTKVEDIYRLQGSKYLQSSINDAYRDVRRYLENGIWVYFSGTPCQVAGLYAFLRKKYDNLVTQDCICHGVPSSIVWQKYLKLREIGANAKTRSVIFRYKKNGWRNYSILLEFENGKKYETYHSDDLYMRGFISNLYLRPSCHACKYKNIERCADITLADFWGVEKLVPDMSDNKGTSLVICHSEKGMELLKLCKNTVMDNVNIDYAVQYNPSMIKSAVRHPKRAEFFEGLHNNKIDYQIKACLKESLCKCFLRRMKLFTKRMLNNF